MKETEINELEFRISLWKNLQAEHVYDEAFFHYSQKIIDDLEVALDMASRLEN